VNPGQFTPSIMKLRLGERSIDVHDVATIARSLDEMDWEKDLFAILSRDKLTFIQATGSHREGFIVEYMDGADERFYRAAGKANIEAVKMAFLAYHRADPSWQTSFQWQKADARVEGRWGWIKLAAVIALIALFLFAAIANLIARLHRIMR
jgi:hypothetical protein